jgi:hypothetical protein
MDGFGRVKALWYMCWFVGYLECADGCSVLLDFHINVMLMNM